MNELKNQVKQISEKEVLKVQDIFEQEKAELVAHIREEAR
jgi:uncharacterized membrane-anchored protein YhcB (DUF1043 family)